MERAAGREPMITVAPDHPDAWLVALCAGHIENLAAVNGGEGNTDIMADLGDDPGYIRYRESCDAINLVEPKTRIGMVAKALAAKAEAWDGVAKIEDPCGGALAEAWAWQLVNDLLAGVAER